VVGFGTLVRPETPLLIISAGLVLVARWWRPADWMKLVRAGVLMGVGVLLPLVPWAARNWFTLNHDVQFLAPRYSELPGEYTPLGFTAWTNTWLWRYRDVYLTQWKVNSEEISMDDIPAYAFDSEDERQKTSDILDEYNDVLTIDPARSGARCEISRGGQREDGAASVADICGGAAEADAGALVYAADGTVAVLGKIVASTDGVGR
jgi:hypothetical protein